MNSDGIPLSFAQRKAHRKLVAEAEWTDRGGKHLAAATQEQAMLMSLGRGSASQYLPAANNRELEKLAAQHGLVVPGVGSKKTIYFYHEFDDIVGYDGGQATRWIRAEITSGTLHGFPIHSSNLPSVVRKQS